MRRRLSDKRCEVCMCSVTGKMKALLCFHSHSPVVTDFACLLVCTNHRFQLSTMEECTVFILHATTVEVAIKATVPWQATRMYNRKKNCMACMLLRFGHCFAISSGLVGFWSQKSSLLCSSARSKAGLTACRGAARWLTGESAANLEALGLGLGGYGGLVAVTALSLHLQHHLTCLRHRNFALSSNSSPHTRCHGCCDVAQYLPVSLSTTVSGHAVSCCLLHTRCRSKHAHLSVQFWGQCCLGTATFDSVNCGMHA